MTDIVDFNAFSAHAKTVAERFELRRKRYIKKLLSRSIVAAFMLLSFPAWFSLMVEWNQLQSTGLSSLGLFVIKLISGGVLLVGIITYAVLPVFRYRRRRIEIGNAVIGVSGNLQHVVSLKSDIWGELLKFFGNFSLYSDRKITLRSIRNAPAMPDFDVMQGEDYIRGRAGDVTIEIMETRLIDHRGHEQMESFHGLLVLIDVSSPDVVLHRPFTGRTLVTYGPMMLRPRTSLDLMPLPVTEGQTQFAVYSDVPEEAARLVSHPLLDTISALVESMRHMKNQQRHVDDKLVVAVARIAEAMSDVISAVAHRLGLWLTNGSMRLTSKRHDMIREQTADDYGSDRSKPYVITNHAQCAFYDDKVLLLIPYGYNLFEPNPIFSPPLVEEDIQLIHTLMTSISAIAGQVVRR